MSSVSIKLALEARLRAMPNGLPTAWENVNFTPQANVPWQRVYVLPAESFSPAFGAGSELVQESGLLQVTLCYPLGAGTTAVLTQAERIRAWFPKGLTLTAGGVEVQITKRASVAPANRDEGWVLCSVSIPYFSNLFMGA